MSRPHGAAQWYAIVLIQYLLINQLSVRSFPSLKISAFVFFRCHMPERLLKNVSQRSAPSTSLKT